MLIEKEGDLAPGDGRPRVAVVLLEPVVSVLLKEWFEGTSDIVLPLLLLREVWSDGPLCEGEWSGISETTPTESIRSDPYKEEILMKTI